MKYAVVLCLLAIVVAVSADCDVGGKKYKTGESWQPTGTCTQRTCTGDNSFSGKACPLMAVHNPEDYTHIPDDPSKPYPSCCAHFEKKN